MCWIAETIPLLDAHALTLHAIPFSAFDSRLPLPLDPKDGLYRAFPPILSAHTSTFRINVDGLLTLSNAQANAKEQRAYVQVFHTGIIEAVASSFLGDGTPQSLRPLTAMKTEAPRSIGFATTRSSRRARLLTALRTPFAASQAGGGSLTGVPGDTEHRLSNVIVPDHAIRPCSFGHQFFVLFRSRRWLKHGAIIDVNALPAPAKQSPLCRPTAGATLKGVATIRRQGAGNNASVLPASR